MSDLSNRDRQVLETMFGMSSGYVLDFSDRTFSSFFDAGFNVNIFDQKYDYNSGSKANRLRAFWNLESNDIVGKVIEELLEHWKTENLIHSRTVTEHQKMLYVECTKIANKLRGNKTQDSTETEEEFLKKDFDEVSITSLNLDGPITNVLEQRMGEIRKSLNAKSPLAVIFLVGSTLEGILLGTALKSPKNFVNAKSSPKDKTGTVKQLQDWKLSQLIDVACEISLLDVDVKKFSHVLREFRNYIHPYQQMSEQFNPDPHTAHICWQVLKAAINDLSQQT